MSVIIYHNPRCSKSRQTLQLLESQGIQPEIKLYLENPLKPSELSAILKKLGISSNDLLRTQEPQYRQLVKTHGQPNETQALEWMIQYPKLMERPIVVHQSQAKIGRPPEAVLEIL